MRPIPTLLALSLAALPAFASAADFDNWPTKYAFGDGTELAATANIAYDYNDFSSGSGLEDDDAVRRKEFGATLKKKGVYDAMVYYDFQADTWLDVFVRFAISASSIPARWSPPTRSGAPAWKASGSAAHSRCRPKPCAPRSPAMTASPTTPAAASTRWPAGC